MSAPDKKMPVATKKTLWIVGGISAVALVVVVAMGLVVKSKVDDSGKEGSAQAALGGSGQAVTRAASEPPNPQALRELDLSDAEKAKQAHAAGQNYVPPVMPAQTLDLPVQDASARQAQSDSRVAEVAAQQQREQQERERIAALQSTYENELVAAAVAQVNSAAVANYAQSSEDIKSGPRRVATSTSVTSGAPGASGASGSLTKPTLVKAHQVAVGKTVAVIDTAITPTAWVKIEGGPLDGASLNGTAKVSGDSLVITMTSMSFKGEYYAINAVVLDEITSQDAMTAGVSIDNRYFQRFVLPIGAAMVGGFEAARATTGSTVVTGPGGTTISQPTASVAQAQAAGIAKGMDLASAQVQKLSAMDRTGKVPAEYPVGVKFLTPVLGN